MALSTLQVEPVQLNVDLSLGDRPFWRDQNYICVPTTLELKEKIISSINNLPVLPQQSLLVQFWAATKIGKHIVLLTTTCQPFALFGNNKGLQAYHDACLHHKFYVYRDKVKQVEVAFGLPGMAFLYCTPVRTQDLHVDQPADHRPLCTDGAIFKNRWGSFAVPVVEDNECVGVLDFVMATPKDSYFTDIVVVQHALQHAGFQPCFQPSIPFQTNLPRRSTYTSGTKKSRNTDSSEYGRYSCLAQFFGWSKAKAIAKIQETTRKRVTESTFDNARRQVAGLLEWPWISNRKTTQASDLDLDHETQVNPTTFETSSFATPIVTGYTPNNNSDTGFSKSSCVQTMTTQAPIIKYPTNQKPCDASSSELPMATVCASFGPLANSEYMVSNTGLFENPLATQYNSFQDPIDTNYNAFEAPISTAYNSFEALIVPKHSTFLAPTATEYSSSYMTSETGSFGYPVATYHISDPSSLFPIWDIGTSECSYTQSATTTKVSSSETRVNQIAYDGASFGTQVDTEYSPSGTTITTADVGNYEWSFIQNETIEEPLPETPTNHIASIAGWIRAERARPDFMQEFDKSSFDLDNARV